METSEQLDLLSKALVEFHKAVGKVRKDAKNPFFGSRYATLSMILDVVSEPLSDNGLSVIQTPHGEYQLTTMLVHESGQWLRDTYTMTPGRASVMKGEPWEITPQTVGSAITYQRRYALGAILCVNIDEDDDGNAASGQGNKQAKKQTAKEKAAKAAETRLAKEQPGTRPNDASQEALTAADAKWIESCSANIETCDDMEQLITIGEIIKLKNVNIKNALRNLYSEKRAELS